MVLRWKEGERNGGKRVVHERLVMEVLVCYEEEIFSSYYIFMNIM